jgi:hypothetical protein
VKAQAAGEYSAARGGGTCGGRGGERVRLHAVKHNVHSRECKYVWSSNGSVSVRSHSLDGGRANV